MWLEITAIRGLNFPSTHFETLLTQQRSGQLVHGGSHGIFDRLHVVDLRGVRFGVTQHRLRVLSRPAAPDQDKRIRFC